MPGDRLDALGVGALDPAVDGPAAAVEERGDGDPGVAVGEEQEDMRAEADLGVGAVTVEVEESGALLGGRVKAGFHGCAGEWSNRSDQPFLRHPALSGLVGAI